MPSAMARNEGFSSFSFKEVDMRYSNMRCGRRLLTIAMAVIGIRASLGQTITATVEGTVLDSQGAAISNAHVTVQNTGTNITRLVTCDGEGRYFVNTLNPGEYQVTVEAMGFSTKVMKGITLNVGADERLDVPLSVGQDSTTVSVEAQTQTTDTQSSANGSVIDNHQVVELPLANRQFYSLALLSPAAYQPAQNSTLGFRGGINIAGASEISNQFTFNGIYDNDMGVAQPSFRPSVEVIQEFKLLTGVYPAEYGRMSGGQVVILEKSGTNKFHGVVYEFFRNEYTDAKPYFNAPGAKIPAFKQNTFGATLGGPIVRDKTFFFFGFEGQRIRRAVTAQATVPTAAMISSGIFNNGSVLYDPATGAAIPTLPGGGYNLSTQLPTEWSSVQAQAGQTIARLGFPAPSTASAPGAALSNNYHFSETRSENLTEYSLRVDHKLTEKDSVFGSFNYFKDPAFEPSNSLCSSYVLPNFGCFTDQHSTLANITYDRILNANALNELRLGFQRLVQPRTQQDNTTIGGVYPGLPGGPYFTQGGYANNLGLPNVAVTGYSTIGGATNLPQDRWDNHYQIVDVLTYNRGSHTFKTGVDLFLARTINIITSTGRGGFTFNDSSLKTALGSSKGRTGDSLADFLLGYPYTSTVGTTAGTVYLNFQSTHLFVQDDWKVNHFLTLNLGLRWELDAPVYSPHDTISNFNLATQQFVAAGPTQFKHLYSFDYNNLAPRVGFAWQPMKDDSTVLKGAAGIFYNTPLLYNQFLTNGTQYPFRSVVTNTTSQVLPITLANPFPSNLPPCTTSLNHTQTAAQQGCLAGFTPLNISPNYSTPYIQEWSLGVQQALGKTRVMEITYFGSKGTRLPLSVNVNQINLSSYRLLPNQKSIPQSDRPFPGYGTVTSQDTQNSSSFHSLQTSLRQTYSNGVTFTLSYTFAKSIDGGGGIGSSSNSSGSPQDMYNLRAERGLSDFDVRNRLVFSPLAELPFGRGKSYFNQGLGAALLGGMQLSGIFQYQSGRPFTVSDSASNNSGSFAGADRPNIVANPNAGVDSVTGARTHAVGEWFNTHAFALAPGFKGATATAPAQSGQFGNAGRNIVTGPGLVQLDATLARNFPILESVKGQFRVESFNLLNHPNFFNPLTQGVQYGTSSFGAITQAYDNREFQFSLRILY